MYPMTTPTSWPHQVTVAKMFVGEYCSKCMPNYFRQGKRCIKCEDGEQLLMYIYIGTFVGIFNSCLFFLPYDVMDVLFGILGTLQACARLHEPQHLHAY